LSLNLGLKTALSVDIRGWWSPGAKMVFFIGLFLKSFCPTAVVIFNFEEECRNDVIFAAIFAFYLFLSVV